MMQAEEVGLDGCETFPSKAQTAPNEVLLIIFEHLELKDRLSVRQVCRKWFDACQDKRFQTKEKFFIEKSYMSHLSNVLEFFATVDREFLNFEFNGLSFENDTPWFWETCGSKIRSLTFNECELSLDTFGHIVTECVSLQQLILRVHKQKFDDTFLGERDNETRKLDLQSLVESGCVNTSVNFVQLTFRGLKHQWCRWLIQLLRLFPCIKRFVFLGDEFPGDYEAMDRAHVVALNDALFNNNIEDLRLVTYTYQYRELDWTVLATKPQLNMLTEVAVHVNDQTDRALLASFLSRQSHLKTLHLLLRANFRCYLMEDTFEVVFANCPQLNALEVTYSSGLLWGCTWFELLAKSSVTSLKLECDQIFFPNRKTYPPNSKMLKLNLHFKSGFNDSTLPMIKAFSSLKELTIFKITYKIMRSVLQHQRHLVAFNARFKARLVCKVRTHTSEMFADISNDTGLPLDFSSLDADRLSMPADLAKRPNFMSSHLKYLHLYPPMGEVFYNPISLDTNMSPLLEEVIIETSCFSYPLRGTFMESIMRFIAPLNRLRFLYLTSRTRLVYSYDMPYLDDDFVRRVFERCPTLRCFVYKRIYFRNNLKRQFLIVADMDEDFSRASSICSFNDIHLPRVQYVVQL